MRRREFIALVGGAAVTWPLVAHAQQIERVRKLGVLIASLEIDPEGQARIAALRQGLQELGWIEGRNIKIEYRWIAADSDRIKSADAAALVALKPEVILAGPTSALAVLRPETQTIPIVFVQVTDPVGSGFVSSLDHPGGNITGFSQFEFTVGAKWVELLKQIAPSVARIGMIYDPVNPTSANYISVPPMRSSVLSPPSPPNRIAASFPCPVRSSCRTASSSLHSRFGLACHTSIRFATTS